MIRLISKTMAKAVLETLEHRQLLHAAVIDAIPNYTIPVGKIAQIPISATYDHGDALVYTITDNSTGITTSLHPTTNTWIEMTVQGYSTPMKFELFNDLAPDTVRRMTGLINAGYFDGMKFHRVINSFVIQAGDPKSKNPYVDTNGNGSEDAGDNIWGTGGPGFSFDDEFNSNAIFDGDGQLAMANSGKDTNGSQFFITEGPQRALDFNHTIWGQLVKGKATRDSISNVATNSLQQPTTNQVITSMRIVQNTTDAVLQVKLTKATTGTVTVTATGSGGTSSTTFNVTGLADTTDDPPILGTVANVVSAINTAVTIPLTSIDTDGGAVSYSGQFIAQNGASGSISGNNIIVTPAHNYTGPITLYVGVVKTGATSRGSTSQNSSSPLSGIYDLQKITIAVGDKAITATGANVDATIGAPANGLTVATFKDADTAGVAANWTASINWGDGAVTTGTVFKNSSGTFSVLGSHTFSTSVNAAAYPLTVDITGDKGAIAHTTSLANVRSFASLSGTTVTVNGTTSGDKISIGRKNSSYTVTVNNVTRAFATSAVTVFNVFGLGGNDIIALTADAPVSFIDGGDGNDSIVGGIHDDTLSGGAGNDTIYGGDGYDRISGGDGNDLIYGGNGKDRIVGDAGNDYIFGDGGPDIISGNDGNDTLIGGASSDTIYGNNGDDIINGLTGADSLDGGAGTDTAKLDSLDTRIAIEVLV